jgi:hypothetical protein
MTHIDNAMFGFGSECLCLLNCNCRFPLKVGIITAVLMGLQSTKVLTNKRIEFFREASSGYNINAYFVAINITATLEHSTQALIIAFFAAWLREPIANWWSFFIHFIMLTWICISWGFLIPMVFPPDNVVIIIGFFMAFCGLLISGALPPVGYKEIYSSGFTEHLTAWLSPTRFFYEALMVGDLRCLPEQTGMTVEYESVNFPRDYTVIRQLGLAGHDLNATLQSCDGWYWDVLPSLLVGLTIRFAAGLAMHTFNRAQQTKKPLRYEMKRSGCVKCWVIGMILALLFLGIFTASSYTADEPHLFVSSEVLVEEYSSEDEFVQALLNEYNITTQKDLDELLAASNFTPDDLSNFTIPPSFDGEIPNSTLPEDILTNATFGGV